MAFAIPAQIELKKRHRSFVRQAVVASVVAHGLIFVLSPPFSFKPYQLNEQEDMLMVVEPPPDVILPSKPKDISPPEIQVTPPGERDTPDDEFPGTSHIDFRDLPQPPAPPGPSDRS
ncbi:MAG: hypothetical protein JSW58_00095, partial [Candidatus Latescibacterota bacterium]